MVTIKDVAKYCNYSVSTVSYALNGSKEIPEETRNKILAAAKDLHYVPSAYASGLKRKKTFNIGVFISDFDGPIHHKVLSGIATGINDIDKRYKILVTVSDKSMTMIKERLIDLAIIYDSKVDEELIKELSDILPIVTLDKKVDSKNVFNVDVNNKSAMYDQTQKLLKRGCKRIGYLYGPHVSHHNHERFLGYKEALNDNDMYYPELFFDADSFTEEKGYITIKELLQNNKTINFDGLMCSNDELAFGAIRALNEFGFNIPKDVKVTGFDNIDKCSLTIPTLSTISVDWNDFGKKVIEYAINVLNKKVKTKDYMINSANVIERGSTE